MNYNGDPHQYIKFLEEQNKLKLKMKAEKETNDVKRKKKMEKNFVLYFDGANKSEMQTIKKKRYKKKSSSQCIKTRKRKHIMKRKTSDKPQTWGPHDNNTTLLLRTDDGDIIPFGSSPIACNESPVSIKEISGLSPNCDDYEDDDFESEDNEEIDDESAAVSTTEEIPSSTRSTPNPIMTPSVDNTTYNLTKTNTAIAHHYSFENHDSSPPAKGEINVVTNNKEVLLNRVAQLDPFQQKRLLDMLANLEQEPINEAVLRKDSPNASIIENERSLNPSTYYSKADLSAKSLQYSSDRDPANAYQTYRNDCAVIDSPTIQSKTPSPSSLSCKSIGNRPSVAAGIIEDNITSTSSTCLTSSGELLFSLCILSTWDSGVSGCTGLTGIELFDAYGSQISIEAGDISLCSGLQEGPSILMPILCTSNNDSVISSTCSSTRTNSSGFNDLSVLVNQKNKTTNMNNMWKTGFPTQSEALSSSQNDYNFSMSGNLRIDITIRDSTSSTAVIIPVSNSNSNSNGYPDNTSTGDPNSVLSPVRDIGSIIVWNYNKNITSSSIGVKDAVIMVNNVVRWKGEIKKGCGNKVFDYSTRINLSKGNNSIMEANHTNIEPSEQEDTYTRSSGRNNSDCSPNNSTLMRTNNRGNEPSLTYTEEEVMMSATATNVSPTFSRITQQHNNYHSKGLKDSTSNVQANQYHSIVMNQRALDIQETNRVLQEALYDIDSLLHDNRSECDVERASTSAFTSTTNLNEIESQFPFQDNIKIPPPHHSQGLASSPSHVAGPSTASTSNNTSTSINSNCIPPVVPSPSKDPRGSQAPIIESLPMMSQSNIHNLYSINSVDDNTSLVQSWETLNRFTRASVGRLYNEKPSLITGDQQRFQQPSFHDISTSSLLVEQSPNNSISTSIENLISDLYLDGDCDNSLVDTSGGDISGGANALYPGSVLDATESSQLKRNMNDNNIDSSDLLRYEIPELPNGRTLTISIVSNWGDLHYVGLSGLECYNHLGELIEGEVSVHGAMEPSLDTHLTSTTTPANTTTAAAATSVSSDTIDSMLCRKKVDPRKINNLLNGINFTTNDLNFWLAPLSDSNKSANTEEINNISTHPDPSRRGYYTITFKFNKVHTLAMVRIWNYNNSRIHSCRGVRRVHIQLSDVSIFDGEIRQASGDVVDPMANSEMILFTSDLNILESIAASENASVDKYTGIERSANNITTDQTSKLIGLLYNQIESHRPSTGHHIDYKHTPHTTHSRGKTASSAIIDANETFDEINSLLEEFNIKNDSSPSLRTSKYNNSNNNSNNNNNFDINDFIMTGEAVNTPEDNIDSNQDTTVHHLPRAKIIEIQMTSNWGDPFYIGLTGVQVLIAAIDTDRSESCNIGETVFPLAINNLDANPRDLNSADSNANDHRTLDKLIDGVNNTTSDQHMWLIPFVSDGHRCSKDATPSLSIDLGDYYFIKGLNIWNYNKSEEGSYRGAKRCRIILDKFELGNFIFRKATGCSRVDNRQFLPFYYRPRTSIDVGTPEVLSENQSDRERILKKKSLGSRVTIHQDYETITHPSGFIFSFKLKNTWGDSYYLGLDCIEFLDTNGQVIPVSKANAIVFASPASINDLPEYSVDTRVPWNLFQKHFKKEGRCWLAPLVRPSVAEELSKCNTVDVIFNQLVTIGAIKIHNYSKTPSRGAQHLELWLDGILLYSGVLKKHDTNKMLKINGDKNEKISVVGTSSTPTRIHSCDDDDGVTSILFTDNESIVQDAGNTVQYSGNKEQPVLFINEMKALKSNLKTIDAVSGGFTFGVKVDRKNRPLTSTGVVRTAVTNKGR